MKRPASTRSEPATNGSPILSPRMKTEKSTPPRGAPPPLPSAGAAGRSMASRYNLHDLPGAVYSDEL